MPLVTFLIPVHNAAGTLDEALGSVQAQTFTEWQAILVDDGSEDGSGELLRAWCRRDPRFTLLRNPVRCGIAASLGRALETVDTPLVARMDADDVSLPERLERQVELLQAEDLAAAGCRVRYFPEEAVAGGARRYEEWLNGVVTPEEHDREVFVECPLAHPTLLARTEALRQVGGYRAPGWPEDYDLCLRFWEAGLRMAKVPEVLLRWREHARRTSRVHPDYRPEAFYRCKAHFLRRTHLAERPAVIFGAGPVGKCTARALLQEGAAVTAFVDLDPRKIGQRPYGIPILSRAEGFELRGQAFGLAALGQPGARQALREALQQAGWAEGTDFRCVA